MLNGMSVRTIAVTVAFATLLLGAQNKGILLEDLTWVEAEKVLTPD